MLRSFKRIFFTASFALSIAVLFSACGKDNYDDLVTTPPVGSPIFVCIGPDGIFYSDSAYGTTASKTLTSFTGTAAKTRNIQIKLTDLGINTYTIGTAGNTFTYTAGTNINPGVYGTVRIGRLVNNKISGLFSVTLSTGNVIRGNFQEVQVR